MGILSLLPRNAQWVICEKCVSKYRELIFPAPEAECKNIHYNRHGIDNPHGNQFALHALQADDHDGKAKEIKVAD